MLLLKTRSPKGFLKNSKKKMKKLIDYFIESKNELAKVVWPSRKATISMSIAVVVIAVVVSLFLGLVDYGLTRVLGLIL